MATTDLAESRYRVVDLSFSKHTPDRDNQKAQDYSARILWDVGIALDFIEYVASRRGWENWTFGKSKFGWVETNRTIW